MRVVAAADRLLTGRTGILIAHRLSTIERAPLVAVLDHGTVVQQGARSRLAEEPGPFRDLLLASRAHQGLEEELDGRAETETEEHSTPDHAVGDRKSTRLNSSH